MRRYQSTFNFGGKVGLVHLRAFSLASYVKLPIIFRHVIMNLLGPIGKHFLVGVKSLAWQYCNNESGTRRVDNVEFQVPPILKGNALNSKLQSFPVNYKKANQRWYHAPAPFIFWHVHPLLYNNALSMTFFYFQIKNKKSI